MRQVELGNEQRRGMGKVNAIKVTSTTTAKGTNQQCNNNWGQPKAMGNQQQPTT